jgi:hypothetical protein
MMNRNAASATDAVLTGDAVATGGAMGAAGAVVPPPPPHAAAMTAIPRARTAADTLRIRRFECDFT